jgi:hypothetical protein
MMSNSNFKFKKIENFVWADRSCSYNVILSLGNSTAYSDMFRYNIREIPYSYDSTYESKNTKREIILTTEDSACFSMLFNSIDSTEFDDFVTKIEYKILQVERLSDKVVKTYIKQMCKVFGYKARFKKDYIVLSDCKNKYLTLALLSMLRMVYEYYRSNTRTEQVAFIKSAKKWKTFEDMLTQYKTIQPDDSYGTGHAPSCERVVVKSLSEFIKCTESISGVNELFY